MVWHVTTICKHVQVVRQGHVVISSCKPRKQQSYVYVLQITYIKHILGTILFIQPVSVEVVLFVYIYVLFIYLYTLPIYVWEKQLLLSERN